MTTLTTALDVVGMVAITAGAALIYWPAGLIVGGILCALMSLSIERSAKP